MSFAMAVHAGKIKISPSTTIPEMEVKLQVYGRRNVLPLFIIGWRYSLLTFWKEVEFYTHIQSCDCI